MKTYFLTIFLFFFSLQVLSAQVGPYIDSLRQLADTTAFPERIEHINKWYQETNELFRDEHINLLGTATNWLEEQGLKTDEHRFEWASLKLKIGFMYADNERLSDLFKTASTVVSFIDSVGLDNKKWHSLKGHAYFQLNLFASLDRQPQEALKYLDEAYGCFEKAKNKSLMARALNSMGASYADLGENEKALELEKRAGDLYEEDGNEYGVLRARHYYAANLIDVGRYEEALRTYREIIPRMRQNKHISLNASLSNYGDVLTQTGNYREAKRVLDEALELAKFRKVNYTVSLTYRFLSNLHERTGNYAAALEAEKLHAQFQDSIQLQSQEELLKSAQAKFENYKKEQRIKELEKEQAIRDTHSRNRFLTLLSGILLLIGIAGFWIYRQSQRNKYEKALREKEQELSSLKERLFTNITHDLRTPLSLIISPLENLLSRKLEPSERQQLNLALDNSQQLLHLVNQILDWHSLEARVMRLQPFDGEIVQAVNSCVGRFQGAADKKEITLQSEMHAAPQRLFFDFDKLDKILSNLVANALRYTPAGGQVTIRTSLSDQLIQLEVSDTGQGIPSAKQASIFERFEKQTVSPERNSGIGLALVQELVQLMKGTIQLQSAKGAGSTFTVQLPCENSQQKTMVSENIKQADKPSLLLIEDHPELSLQISHILSDHYQVTTKPTATAGLAAALEQIPDIIISDLMLPDKSGLELCKDLKEHMLTDHIPILILTARTDETARLSGLEVRADAFLTKPFKTTELILQLNNLLTNRRRLRLRFEMQQKEVEERRDPFIDLLLQTVESNYDESGFNVDAFAQKLRMSRVQLFKKTKALLGTTPSKVIRQYRLEQAKNQLQASDRSVAEIAYGCGFSSPEYFSTVYKEHFGVRPTEER